MGSLTFVLTSIPRGADTDDSFGGYNSVRCQAFSELEICHIIRGYGRPFVWVEVDRVSIGRDTVVRMNFIGYLYGHEIGDRISLTVESLFWWAIAADLSLYFLFFLLLLSGISYLRRNLILDR